MAACFSRATSNIEQCVFGSVIIRKKKDFSVMNFHSPPSGTQLRKTNFGAFGKMGRHIVIESVFFFFLYQSTGIQRIALVGLFLALSRFLKNIQHK